MGGGSPFQVSKCGRDCDIHTALREPVLGSIVTAKIWDSWRHYQGSNTLLDHLKDTF